MQEHDKVSANASNEDGIPYDGVNQQCGIPGTIGGPAGVPADLPELAVVEELCGAGSDLRNLRLIARMVTEENAYKAFLDQAFLLFDP